MRNIATGILLASVLALAFGTIQTAYATTYYLQCDQGYTPGINCYAAGPWHQCGSGYRSLSTGYFYFQNTCSDWFYCVNQYSQFINCGTGPSYISHYVHAIWSYTSWYKWNGFEYNFYSRTGPSEVYLCTQYPNGCGYV